jgi:hypothetical protein
LEYAFIPYTLNKKIEHKLEMLLYYNLKTEDCLDSLHARLVLLCFQESVILLMF